MKRVFALLLLVICLPGLCACQHQPMDTPAQTQEVAADYGKVIELARAEFMQVFKEFVNVKIEETATMTRTDDAREILVQIRYTSGNGNGVYGFLYKLDAYDNPELIQHGEQVTIDNLLK